MPRIILPEIHILKEEDGPDGKMEKREKREEKIKKKRRGEDGIDERSGVDVCICLLDFFENIKHKVIFCVLFSVCVF